MSASAKARRLEGSAIKTNPKQIQKLGVFAGGGKLPLMLINYCVQNHIETFVVGFEGHADKSIYDHGAHIETRVAASGKTLKWLAQHDVHDVVFIGSIERPKLRSMIPDWTTLWFFLTKGIWAKGDNALLKAARRELERRHIALHGVHKFLPELLASEGNLTQQTTEGFQADIELGITESQILGAKDMGQAVIVKNGKVLGREDAKGTNSLVRRFGKEGAVLVKTCKPQQDTDLDLPTIGLGTIKACAEKNMAGIVVHAGNSLFLDQEEAVKRANQNNMFIMGIST